MIVPLLYSIIVFSMNKNCNYLVKLVLLESIMIVFVINFDGKFTKLEALVSLYRSSDLNPLSVKKCLLSRDFLSSIVTFGYVVSEEKSFEISANQKQECL